MKRPRPWPALCFAIVLRAPDVAAAPEPDSVVEGPRSECRVFRKGSAQVWETVLKALVELGVPPKEVDKKHQVAVTEWRRFGAKGPHWLPAAPRLDPFVAERIQFQVFVSPFVEPARLYVGSVVEYRAAARHAIAYNDTAMNQALIASITGMVGEDGMPLPAELAKRRELSVSFLGDKAGSCFRDGLLKPVKESPREPKKIRLSERQIVYPAPALEERSTGPVTVNFWILEDGSVTQTRVASPLPDPRMAVAAMGVASLLLYVPTELEGCWVPTMAGYRVNFRLR